MVSSASSTTAHCFGVRLLASSRTMWSCRARILLSARDQGPLPSPQPCQRTNTAGSLLQGQHLAQRGAQTARPPRLSPPALTFSLESCPSSLAALKIICVPCGEQRDRNGPSERPGWWCHAQAGHMLPGAHCSSGGSPGSRVRGGGPQRAQGPRAMPGMVLQAQGAGADPVPAPELSAEVCGWETGDSGQDITLASGASRPAQHRQLGLRVPSCSLWCPSTRLCIWQSPAQHITGTAWTIVRRRGEGSRERVQGDSGHGEDAAWSPCTPQCWQPRQTPPCHPDPCPC